MSDALPALRKKLRLERRQLSPFVQRKSEQQLLNLLRHVLVFNSSKKVGLYLHAFGEIQTKKIIELCFKQHKHVYLPMICNMNQTLVWVKINANQYRNKRFSHNR